MLRPPEASETEALLSIAVATGLFQPAEAAHLLGGVLAEFHRADPAANQLVLIWKPPDESPAGWVYFARDPYSERVWNLWWIGVVPSAQGTGIGGRLLSEVEVQVQARGGRVLVIETSASPELEQTRRFYARRGYAACGRVPEFYGEGDDKLIFARRLSGGSRAPA